MEQNLQDLNVNGLNMKLTTEKLFVNSATATETFALRSINGVGIVDLVNKFDDELKEWNAKNNPKGLTEEQKKDSLEKISKELIKYLAKK